jgi:hypothetical protein
MVRRLLLVAAVAASLLGCSRPQAPSSAGPALAGASQTDPSPLVKIAMFGYRPHRGGANVVEVSVPQIPHAADFVVRGTFTDAGMQSGISAARVRVEGSADVSTQPLAKGPAFELVIPTSGVKLGLHGAYVEMVGANGTAVAFAKPILFEVDAAAGNVPAGIQRTAPIAGNIDICCRLSEPQTARSTELQTALNDSVLVQGWAYDPSARTSGRGLLLVVDGTRAFEAEYGIARPDVAASYRNDAVRDSGYAAIVPASAFSAGQHTVNLMLLSKDGRHAYAFAKPPVTFSVK